MDKVEHLYEVNPDIHPDDLGDLMKRASAYVADYLRQLTGAGVNESGLAYKDGPKSISLSSPNGAVRGNVQRVDSMLGRPQFIKVVIEFGESHPRSMADELTKFLYDMHDEEYVIK